MSTIKVKVRRSWRPENWDVEFDKMIKLLPPENSSFSKTFYESGGKVMLEALKPLLEYCWPSVRMSDLAGVAYSQLGTPHSEARKYRDLLAKILDKE